MDAFRGSWIRSSPSTERGLGYSTYLAPTRLPNLSNVVSVQEKDVALLDTHEMGSIG